MKAQYGTFDILTDDEVRQVIIICKMFYFYRHTTPLNDIYFLCLLQQAYDLLLR